MTRSVWIVEEKLPDGNWAAPIKFYSREAWRAWMQNYGHRVNCFTTEKLEDVDNGETTEAAQDTRDRAGLHP